MFSMTEHLLHRMDSCGPGHDDHGTKGDVLQRHCQSFVFAVLGHSLGLGAEFAKVVGRGYGHVVNLPVDVRGNP
jgi:hypothetical protein